MSTKIRGTATFVVDYEVDEDLDDLEAEEEFNFALDEIFNGGSDKGSVLYDQYHEFNPAS